MALDLSALDGGLALGQPGAKEGAAARAPLSVFQEDPDNPRFEDDPAAFGAFVADVAQHGILQPIVVRRVAGGMLRIRFGARRFRAALRLGLADAPYVVTEDERQFDDYAQVAENEQRTPLQPLELATFIAGKLAQGEKKKMVAARLRIDASAVTHLLALAGAVPPFILELYHSRKCRSPVYLYELRRLAEQDAVLVARRCAEADEIGRRFIAALAVKVMRRGGAVKTGPVAAGVAVPSGGVAVGSAAPSGRRCTPGAEMVDAPPHAPGAGNTASPASPLVLPARMRLPELSGSYRGRAVILDIARRPSRPDMVTARYCDGGTFEEVALAEIALTRLTDRADRPIRE